MAKICAAAKTAQNLTKCRVCGVFAALISQKSFESTKNPVFLRLPFVGPPRASVQTVPRSCPFHFAQGATEAPGRPGDGLPARDDVPDGGRLRPVRVLPLRRVGLPSRPGREPQVVPRKYGLGPREGAQDISQKIKGKLCNPILSPISSNAQHLKASRVRYVCKKKRG